MKTAIPSSPPHVLLARIAEWALVVLIVLLCGGRTLVSAWQSVNSDFPNYYLTARLVREHVDTTRIYEWTWFQRQKDHHIIDQPLVGLPAVPPISTLAVYPFCALPPLTAKRCWIVLNIVLLVGAILLLSSLTGLPYRHIALVAALSFPLYVNLLFGQYYILLLFVLTLACWLNLREKPFLSGAAIALATALKIFPALYIVYFLRKRNWKALAGCVAGLALLGWASCAVFGWQMNRIYLQQILPPPLRGEIINPYLLTSSSISVLLHHLWIFEPQWNPHPVLHAPMFFAVLQALVPMLLLAPVLLLITPSAKGAHAVRLEWAAILLVALTISTSPALYHFVLLILPACILLVPLLNTRRHIAIAALAVLYLLAGLRIHAIQNSAGWHALLGVSRLYVMILLCCYAGWCLYTYRTEGAIAKDKTRLAWAVALAFFLLANIYTGIRHQRGLYDDYANRISAANTSLLNGYPVMAGNELHAIALTGHSYRAVAFQNSINREAIASQDLQPGSDELSLAAGSDQLWIEEAGPRSVLISGNTIIPDAESPVLSPDQHHLAYLREQDGRGQLWLRNLSQPASQDRPMTSSDFNVFEATFAPSGDLVFSAMKGNSPIAIFRADATGAVTPLLAGESRYPAISPDGRWLAYSRMHSGNWHLRLADLQSGAEKQLTDAACDFTESSWQSDSRTLLYASDCGRAPGLTALSRRVIIPPASVETR